MGGGTVTQIMVSSTVCFYLTASEAANLAEEVRQALVCRIAARSDGPVEVADMILFPPDAWMLLATLEEMVTEEKEEVDWQKEGF